MADPCQPPPLEEDPDRPKDSRDGVFQKIVLTNTWLARLGHAGFGMDDAELYTVWGLPCPTRSWPLVITPGFAAHFLDGPAGLNLPPRVYDAYTEFRWIPRLGPRLRADLAVTPGVHSDFEASGRESVRVTGYGTGIWTWSSTTKIVLGAAYFDRRDVAVLPIAGVVWQPDPDREFRLVFPQPKIAQRFYWGGVYSAEVEHWVYVAGELGGGIWAFQPSGGPQDVFSYRDLRLLFGVESKRLRGLGGQVEVGYVFNRKIHLDSTGVDSTPGDTVLVRGGVKY